VSLPKELVLEASMTAPVAVLFDFDGTLGDTETPAMEVAFWELAPYLPHRTPQDLVQEKLSFIEHNAGRAFEQMIENVDHERQSAGMPSTEESHGGATEISAASLEVIDAARAQFGLKPFAEARKQFPSLLIQQKEETVLALSVCARANPGVIEMLEGLTFRSVFFSIATTSGKPRVPVCVDTAGLRRFFPAGRIHSGESDFDPPRFKPDPAVYELAVADAGCPVARCIAVEDSVSGVGSAANANIGLIVGYVGATHIPANQKGSHAVLLMSGSKSKSGRGADVVITEMLDLLPIVDALRNHDLSAGLLSLKNLPFQSAVYHPCDTCP